MLISQIVAVSLNNVIGVNNHLPWHMPADSEYFKQKTLGHHIVTGRRNYEAEGKALAGRINIVLSRNRDFRLPDGILVHAFQDAINIAKAAEEKELFVVGGEEIYTLALPLTNRIYLTRIHTIVEGDTFYPDLDMLAWKQISIEKNKKDDRNPFDYDYLVYERK